MYIEGKSGGLCGPARIGRVAVSQTGKSPRYAGRTFTSLRGWGFKATYGDTETHAECRISGPTKTGNDALYPDIIEIDEDAHEEPWRDIRNLDPSGQPHSIRSGGKHSTRMPSRPVTWASARSQTQGASPQPLGTRRNEAG